MIKKIARENWIYILILLCLVIVFYFIKNSNLMSYIQALDNNIIDYLGKCSSSLFYPMIIITNIGYWYIPVLLTISMLFLFKDKIYFYLNACFYAFAGLLAFLSKIIIARIRPVIALISIPKSFSFPSGHTLTSICFYFMFAYILTINLSKTQRIIYISIFTIVGILVGFSRIYLGVHYFSDVIGGIILSIPCLLMFTNIVNKNFKEVLK